MKAVQAKLLDLLKRSPQFVIPIFQRTYSWTEKDCAQLWKDVMRAGSREDVTGHFVGSVVYIEEGMSQVTSQSPVLVIDGQQRLTTVTLLLEALARRVGDGEPVPGFSADKIRGYYLLNPLESGERAYKLLLTQTDEETLKALVKQRALPEGGSVRVRRNFEALAEWVDGLDDVAALCRGLDKLVIVDVALNRDHDDPQLIFESMNSTGRELGQADLIRNFVLMGLEPGHQTALYAEHWRPMERLFGQEAYGDRFDGFVRDYLTARTGTIPKQGRVYEAFKAHARSPEVATTGVDALVAELHRYASHFCAIALDREPDPALADAFRDLHELKVDVAYPFLLGLYEDYAAGALSRDDLLAAVRLVESYVFRRAVCAVPTNTLNKTFAALGRQLDDGRTLESLRARLALMTGSRRLPADDEFREQVQQRDLYHFRSRAYWLRRLENEGRKERVPVGEYTVEHILPQNPDLSADWRAALGDGWEGVQQAWLHTLGNLTLTGYNSEYGDRPFPEKRDMEGGFRESPLRVNEGLGAVEVWDEAAIKARAARLADRAVGVWAGPGLPADVLDGYRRTPRATATYTVDDHKHLSGGPVRDLFEAFRRQAVALGPEAREEFTKLYVAYKADTNFVDVIPQAKRLVLSLNIDPDEAEDPRGLAMDVTGKNGWGNGDTEVYLADPGDLPYVMGLVRQAYRVQVDDDGEAG